MYDITNKSFNTLMSKLTKNKTKDASISKINVSDIQKLRIILKSTKEINDTQYSILGDLKTYIEDYQKYNYEPALDKVKTIIETYNNHSSISTTTKSNTFLSNIQNLSITSKEAIVNADKFNHFSKYIHVKREIEATLLNECIELKEKKSGLILLVGSVGDGKSHLLAYLKDEYPELFENTILHNDATESNNPSQTAAQTLESILNDVYKYNKKIIIAINIGMLHNFYSYLQKKDSLHSFQDFIDESGILNTEIEAKHSFVSHKFNSHSIVSFLNEQKIKIINGKIENDFYSQLIERIFSKNLDNPIYASFIKDDGFNRKESIYKNYSFLLNSKVQQSIIYMLNLIQIQDKRILTARSVLNFIYDIIVPTEVDKDSSSTLLASLLFENKEKSKILESINNHDPSQNMIQIFEDLNMRIYNTDNLIAVCQELFKDDFKSVESTILYLSNLNNDRHPKKYSTIVRLYFLLNHKEFISEDYLRYLKILEKNDKNVLKSFLRDLEYVIYQWNGSPAPNYLYKKSWNTTDNIRVAIEFICKFKQIDVQRNSIFISIYNENDDESLLKLYKLEIDYPLYILIQKIASGYMIKNKDRNDAINFNEFIEDIIENTVSMKSTIIKANTSNRLFKVTSGILSPEIEELK